MGFRFGYMLPSVYLTFCWIYSILQGNNESAAYLFLYTAASIPIPLLFALLDTAKNKSPTLQFAIDLAVFAGFYLGIKVIDQGVEPWELLILMSFYSITIYLLTIGRITGVFPKH
jgi:hypothetical protein